MLRAVQIVVDERLAKPTLIGRPAVIAARIAKFGLRLRQGIDYDVVNVEQDDRYRDFWQTYHRLTERKGVTEQLAKIDMRRRIQPKAALLSHSNFGSSDQPTAIKMRQTLALVQQRAPWLEIDGEMHGDVALDGAARKSLMPHGTLEGNANLLVLPNLDAANIAYNLLKTAAGGNIAIGPVLLGAAKPVHILTASTTVRRIVNMTALTVADASALR